jgi:hypothetical protein
MERSSKRCSFSPYQVPRVRARPLSVRLTLRRSPAGSEADPSGCNARLDGQSSLSPWYEPARVKHP